MPFPSKKGFELRVLHPLRPVCTLIRLPDLGFLAQPRGLFAGAAPSRFCFAPSSPSDPTRHILTSKEIIRSEFAEARCSFTNHRKE